MMMICSTSLQKRLIQEFNLLVLLTSRRVEWFRSFAGQMIRTRSCQKSNLGSMWNMYVQFLLVTTKGYSGKWSGIFRKSFHKFWKPVNFRHTNRSTENSRNSAAKVEWKENFREKVFENLGIPREVVLFLGNFRKCCSIHCWKLPNIQTGLFGWIECALELRVPPVTHKTPATIFHNQYQTPQRWTFPINSFEYTLF